MRSLFRLAALLLFALTVTPLSAQTPPQQAETTAEAWGVTSVEIPMRDGVKLHTVILAPRRSTRSMPLLLQRTPYGAENAWLLSAPAGGDKGLSARGYIRVWQDIRGKFKSEGTFVMQRPPHPEEDVNGVDESTDAYDTIDWLLKHVSGNNGRVGITGVSYDGWLAAMALIHPHPALKAVSPQAPVADMFLGDDFHHNGAFRLSYGFEYVWMVESGKNLNLRWPIDLPDAYDWYLRIGPLAHVNTQYMHGAYPSWDDFMAHPNYDAFWQQQAIARFLKAPLTVPTLVVGGWFDQEDFYGPQRIYAALTRHDPHHLAYLVLGPWNHGGWEKGPGQKLGPLDFGSPTGAFFRDQIEQPWFDHWLKDDGKKSAGKAAFPHVHTFETGSNQWEDSESWPPRASVKRKLYLDSGHTASFQPPTATDTDGFDSYLSDPAHPAPYRERPILPTYGAGSTWYTWLTDDQRSLGLRPDVLTWKTAPLTEDLTVTGQVLADLFAATSGTDSDWVVKLLDIYPDDYPADPKMAGYERIVADEVFRGRFRKSFEHPSAIPSNRVEEYRIDLHSTDHVFQKGHRIGVQIQSAWFPLIDRNPQHFVPNIFAAKAEDYQAATQRIYRSKQHATHIEIPVKPASQLHP